MTNRHDRMVARRALAEAFDVLSEDFGDIRSALQDDITIGDIRRVRFELAKMNPGEAMGFVPYIAGQIQGKLNSRMLREALLGSVSYASTKCVPVMRPHVDRFARHLVDPSARFPSDWYESPEYEQGWLMECKEHIAKAIEEMVTSCLPWPHHIMKAMGLDADKVMDIADKAAESILEMGEWEQFNADVSGHIAMHEIDERQVIGKIVVETLKLWKESLTKAQKNESVLLSEDFGDLRAALADRKPSLKDIKGALGTMSDLIDEMGERAYADQVVPYVRSKFTADVIETALAPLLNDAAHYAASAFASYEEEFSSEFSRAVMRNASLYAPVDDDGFDTGEEFDAEHFTLEEMGDFDYSEAQQQAYEDVDGDEVFTEPNLQHLGYDWNQSDVGWLGEILEGEMDRFYEDVIEKVTPAQSVLGMLDQPRGFWSKRRKHLQAVSKGWTKGFLKDMVRRHLRKLQDGFAMNPPGA